MPKGILDFEVPEGQKPRSYLKEQWLQLVCCTVLLTHVPAFTKRAEVRSYGGWGLDVTSSSSYSSASEVKVGSLEVRRFPGIGFSSCAAPTFSHIQGISNGGYELSFQNALEWRKCTRTIPSMSAKVRVMEVCGMCGCAGIGIELIWKSSRVE